MRSKIKHPWLSFSLVTSQFGLIALLAWLSHPWSFSGLAIACYVTGTILGLWALKTMHLGHFNIIPDPMPDIKLVTTGPYAFIRHPMYGSILIFCLPFVLYAPNQWSWLVYGFLALTLIIKLTYEEYLLNQKLADYAIYQTQTKRLLPFVY